MSKFTDSMKSAWRRVRRNPPEQPATKQVDRWENEGGAIGQPVRDDDDDASTGGSAPS